MGSIFSSGSQGGFHKVAFEQDLKRGNCQNGLREDHFLREEQEQPVPEVRGRNMPGRLEEYQRCHYG